MKNYTPEIYVNWREKKLRSPTKIIYSSFYPITLYIFLGAMHGSQVQVFNCSLLVYLLLLYETSIDFIYWNSCFNI